MTSSLQSYSTIFYRSIDAIPKQIWEELQLVSQPYLKPEFLESLEKNHQEIKFYYMILKNKENKVVALANIKIIDFHLDNITSYFENFLNKLKLVLRKIDILPYKKPLKLLITGNIFVSGEHGIFIKTNENKKEIIKTIAKATLVLEKDFNLKIDAFLLKDFLNESLTITDELKDFNYHPFSVEPIMVLHIEKTWRSFDDYLHVLKTKFRVKAKKAFSLSKELTIINITSNNIDDYLPKMNMLYKKVISKATFNLSDFNLATYKDLKLKFGELYILKVYTLQGKVVGFLSGLIHNKNLDAHFVGIDYQLNKTFGIYQRMLYDYIQIAIENNLETLNFGRTASEIKSSVGAKPVDLTMYLRHKRGLTNKILKLFLQRVQPTPFHQNFPFKIVEK
ncbi:MAG: GNAT family N-acetyltransferase [Flavobacteriaceae bacterium]|nr:GNAT family N-acetyltransferase [Flavobacteriaceae bacterium]